MRDVTADLVVVGTGLAGLACALTSPGRVLLLTKTERPGSGSSWLAQGGIAAALAEGDDPEAHAADTLVAGAGLCDPEIVAGLVAEGPDAVAELEALGVRFDRHPDGGLKLGREAAHRAARIVHAGGDATGRAVCEALVRTACASSPRITVWTGAFAWDLLVEDGRVAGLLAYDEAQGWAHVRASRVVLATGGLGGLFAATTNPPEATGDGLALAARAGAAMADLEFVQFHPTALDLPDPRGRPLPLLSEALRGEGALLLDEGGRSLPTLVHPDRELAPRDVVARAIWAHQQAGGRAYLDLRPVLRRLGSAACPQAAAAARLAGRDPLDQPLPVTPAAHYHLGGVVTDAQGATSIPGLWACGEVAATGVHGANRLASNSLLEAFVFGRRVAAEAGRYEPSPRRRPAAMAVAPPPIASGDALRTARQELRRLAWRGLGLVRDEAGLAAAAHGIEALLGRLAELPAEPVGPGRLGQVRACGELRNLILAGRLLAQAAAARRESRGAHHRRDHPGQDGAAATRAVLTATVADGTGSTLADCTR